MQLAVVAHIRHVYTDYDKLLKTGTYQSARAAVEKPCLDLLAQWRSDDDDDDPNAMEEILREVIVIDDDDEDNKDCKSPLDHYRSMNRDRSVEIISSHSLTGDVYLQQTDHDGPAQLIHSDRPYNSEVEDREVFYYPNLEPFRSTHHPRNNQSTLDREGIHHHRWQQALHRHRTNSLHIHPHRNKDFLQRSAVPLALPMAYTEAAPPRFGVENQSRQVVPPETAKFNESPKLPRRGLEGKENLYVEGPDFADRSLHPSSLISKKVSTTHPVWLTAFKIFRSCMPIIPITHWRSYEPPAGSYPSRSAFGKFKEWVAAPPGLPNSSE